MGRTSTRNAEGIIEMKGLEESRQWQRSHETDQTPLEPSPTSSKGPFLRTLTGLSQFATLKRTASGDINCSPWKPVALRAPILTCAVLVSWVLIIVLQLLLAKTQRDGGIIFAPKINDLSLKRSFLYLYFPTVVAVVYSLFWSWIDVETKRLEPYYQLSKPNGALGRDSLMLHYPFDFLPFVPMRAIRNRHWPVFWASTAVVLVSWGLVPLQSGIFATSTITKSYDNPMLVSTSLLSLSQQSENITGQYMTSVFGITWLNETLPPYMARNYTVAPFKTQSEMVTQPSENWTSTTTMYGVDVSCEEAQRRVVKGTEYYTSSNGCVFPTSFAITGNDTMGGQAILEVKQYSIFYAGYWNQNGQADYYLSGYCPIEANHTFYAAYTRNRKSAADPPGNVTAIFCEPNYYSQKVNATVALPLRLPIRTKPMGPKVPVPMTLYNTTSLEWQMNNGVQMSQPRGELPSALWPDQVERISALNISQSIQGGTLPYMAGLAIGASNSSLEEYLNPTTLGEAYEAAYRMIFARSMVDIMKPEFATNVSTIGTRKYRSESIILVSAFTYVVEALLGIVSIFAIALLYLGFTRPRQLRSDPGTIAAVMSLVADNRSVLSDFGHLDCSTFEDMSKTIGKKRFYLEYDGRQSFIQQGDKLNNKPAEHSYFALGNSVSTRTISKPILPWEFRLRAIVPFIVFQVALVVVLALFYQQSKPYGLSLPSNNRIVRQLLENYIPTAIATLIEPIWIAVNRLLCMLQPLEELRTGNGRARKSIALDYSSLPPQLTIWKALRSAHFILAAVCGMVLLANILAVAFSGLFNENSIQVLYPATLHQSLSNKFVSINGSVGPSLSVTGGYDEHNGAYQGGRGFDQFYISESNITTGTALPPWTDQSFMYVPFQSEEVKTSTQGFLATTRAFGAELECTELVAGTNNNFTATVWTDSDPTSSDGTSNFSMTVEVATGKSITCMETARVPVKGAPNSDFGSGSNIPFICEKGSSAMEFVLRLRALPNATQEDQDFCGQAVFLGWGRYLGPNICSDNSTISFGHSNSTFMACSPKFLTGLAAVQVDSVGHIQEAHVTESAFNLSDTEVQQQFFNTDKKNLFKQAHDYFFQYENRNTGLTWHTDSFPTEPFNYELVHATNSTRLLDPKLPAPSFNDVVEPFSKVYSRIFAIWLGANQKNLLLPVQKSANPPFSGSSIVLENRIFVSKAMFIMSEAVLATYAIVSVLVYLRRPGKYLARMPTTIAAIIALFAASSAVVDLEDTAHMSKTKRAQYLDELDRRYGYGTFVGTDGNMHIGIERQPFVRTAPVLGLFQRRPRGPKRTSSKEELLGESEAKKSWVRRFW